MTSSLTFRARLAAALLALPLALLSGGCEDSVDPFVDSTRYYTVYGYLDTALDTQYVRVIPIRQSLDTSVEAEPLDAAVTLTDLQSGATYALRDSVVRFANGRYGHVYHVPLHPVPGHTYRLEVQRSDGAAASAEATVPAFADVSVEPPRAFGNDRFLQTVAWSDVPAQPFGIEVWYRFSRGFFSDFQEYVFFYPPGRLEPDRMLEVTVDLSADRKVLEDSLGAQTMGQLRLMGIGMRLTRQADAWQPPGGVFDPEVLSQPGTFSNVENGFGFFSAANRYTVEWVLTPEITRRLGYRYPD